MTVADFLVEMEGLEKKRKEKENQVEKLKDVLGLLEERLVDDSTIGHLQSLKKAPSQDDQD